MPPLVGTGTQIKCTFGASPAPLTVTPGPPHLLMAPTGVPIATINDHLPMTNISTFGMCIAPTNPAVVAAQGAPAPCVPVIPAPWVSTSAVLISGIPALSVGGTCACTYGGVIAIVTPVGGPVVTVP
jgi:hypothetical protein